MLWEPDAELAPALAASLDGPVRAIGSSADTLAAAGVDSTERVLVIGPGAPLAEVLPTAAALRAQYPQLAILLMRRQIIPDEVADAVAAGVRQVLPDDDPRPLVAACRQVQQESVVMVEDPPMTGSDKVQPAVPGQVITVFSPKGGSGKTTIATNLAIALHDSGGRRVCLIDLDLEFGDVGISLRLEPVKSLIDAVTTDVPDDDDEAIRVLTTPYRPGLDCILAPIEPGAAARIPAELVGDLLRLLKSRYDFVVVDTPSQLSEIVLSALDATDGLVLITNPEIPSLKNLRLTLDMLDLLAFPQETRLVVFNKADDAAGLATTEVQEALGVPIDAVVPASRDVPASINRGVPIVAGKPEHPVSVAIRDFAAMSIVKAPAAGARRKRGLFRRRSS